MITEIDKQAALVLIDFQKSNVTAQLAHPVEEVLSKANMLIAAFHAKGLPVIVINVNPFGASWTKARVEQTTIPQNAILQTAAKVSMSIEGATNIAEELQVRSTDIYITKQTWNAFYNTTLHAQLQQQNITQIVLAGISTSIGVEGTARAASELGYNIAFATDAMTDRVAAAHSNSLLYIFPRIGELGSVEEIVGKMKKTD